VRSLIETGCLIDNSLLMGADFYQPFIERSSALKSSKVPLGIGCDTTIRRAIVDKNACIGRNVQIINKDQIEEAARESQGFYIRSGIVVVMKNAVIPDGTII
jgi:glucose-1-phosphate adenylyltransferase